MGVELSRELLVAAKGGNRRAFDQVGRWMMREVLALYTAQGRPPEDAHELGQKTLEDLVKKFQSAPEDPEEFRNLVVCFAMKTPQRHKTDVKRHENKRAAAHVHPRTPARRPDSMLSLRRLLAWVGSELGKLSTPMRHTLGLTLERDSYQEIAEELDVAEGTVGRRVWEVRHALKGAQHRSRRTSKRFRT